MCKNISSNSYKQVTLTEAVVVLQTLRENAQNNVINTSVTVPSLFRSWSTPVESSLLNQWLMNVLLAVILLLQTGTQTIINWISI